MCGAFQEAGRSRIGDHGAVVQTKYDDALFDILEDGLVFFQKSSQLARQLGDVSIRFLVVAGFYIHSVFLCHSDGRSANILPEYALAIRRT